MKKIDRVANVFVRKLWTIAAVALVLVALFVSLLRYSVPLLENREHLIEQYVKNEYGIDLSIEAISATWKTSGPSIELRNVDIQQEGESPASMKIGEAYLAIDFWPTLLRRKLQTRNVALQNLHLSLNIDMLEQQTSSASSNLSAALEAIFFEQLTQFSVTKSKLTLLQAKQQNTVQINQLSWLNEDNRHQALGEFALAGFASNTASFILDLRGTIDSYDGVLFAQGNALDISPWLSELGNVNGELVSSSGNFALWADIKKGVFTSLQAQLLPSTFEWKTDDSLDLNAKVSAHISARLVDSTYENRVWNFAVDNLVVDTNGERFNAELLGKLTNQDELTLQTQHAIELAPLLPLTELLSVRVNQNLTGVNPLFTVPQLFIKADQEGLAFVAQNNQLSWQAYQDIPGIDALSLDLLWQHDQGLLRFHTQNANIESDVLFDNPLSLDLLNMPVRIHADASNWRLLTDDSELSLNSVDITPSLRFDSSTQELSVTALLGSFPVTELGALLPNKYLSPRTKTFLNKALIGDGDLTQAQIIWNGRVTDYPFNDNSGTFQASIDISDADFMFSDEWPALKDLDLNLFFENNSLNMFSDTATFGGIELGEISASLPRLRKNAVLAIDANASSNGQSATRLITQSRLKNTLGKILTDNVVINGPIDAQLSLSIPLANPKQTTTTGKVRLKNSDVEIVNLKVNLENAKGLIAFENEAIDIQGVEAKLLGKDILLDVSGNREDKAYALDIGAKGNWELKDLVASHFPQIGGYIDGSAEWSIESQVSLLEGSYTYEASLQSQLLSVDSTLPQPFNKVSNEAVPLRLTANGNKFASEISATLGADVRFDGILPHKELAFSRAHLALGQTDFVGMGVGFSISASLPSMDANSWYALIDSIIENSHIGNSQGNRRSILSVPERIFAQTDQLLISGNSVTDFNLVAKRLDSDWLFEFDADQIRGSASVGNDRLSKGVFVDADYINISDYTSADNTEPLAIDPKVLPRIRFNCESCSISGIDLGRVNLEAMPNKDGMAIERVNIENAEGTVEASGQWYNRDDDHYTFLSGGLRSEDFGNFLDGLGFDSGIKDSGANIDFVFTWKDSPMEFGFEQLDGQIEWSLNDGYFTEVSDKGSRIFTLLSLNSLVRKLSLDFRDVFAKGFFYDDMSGSIQITEGKADTRDTVIDGGAGEIEIYGYADLVSSELNYNVSFAPNVTGNLPVLVYFFTVSPPSALAALALDQVLTSAKVISNVNYSITGTFDEPILIETGRQSTEVDLPTRRDLFEKDVADEFFPPDPNEFLPMEQGSE